MCQLFLLSTQYIQQRKVKIFIAALAQQFLNLRDRRKARRRSHPGHSDGCGVTGKIQRFAGRQSGSQNCTEGCYEGISCSSGIRNGRCKGVRSLYKQKKRKNSRTVIISKRGRFPISPAASQKASKSKSEARLHLLPEFGNSKTISFRCRKGRFPL